MLAGRYNSGVWAGLIALIGLLIVQVIWLLKMAEAKEQLFNEKADMVLSRTAMAICKDEAVCKNMGACCLEKEGKTERIELHQTELNRIDSLLKHYMQVVNFSIPYTFELSHGKMNAHTHAHKSIYRQRIEDVVSRNGVEINLIVPDRKSFILQEMGLLFLGSLLLIAIVVYVFFQTLKRLELEMEMGRRSIDFLNNMAHEFKTPLTNIQLAVKSINRQSEVKFKRDGAIILDESKKLQKQVEQVLGFSALERNEVDSYPEPFSPDALTLDAIDCMELQAQEKNAVIRHGLNAGEEHINMDKQHWQAVVCNLIDNALKYSGDKPEITITSALKENLYQLKISDNGIGIPELYLSKIFDKYVRVPQGNLHDVKGFGLGLAYVKKVIELAGGTITVDSILSKGTNFTISVPLYGKR